MTHEPALPLNAWLRYDLARLLLRRIEPQVADVLEVGPGAGAIGVRLARRFRYVGVEPDRESYERARARLAGLGDVRCGDVAALRPDERFDLVCGFEVLEHIEDDSRALREWRGLLRDGGWILLSVPAHERRFGPHDRIVGHYRRYDPAALAALLEANGFADPVVLSCGFPFGYALEFARNLIGRVHRPAPTMDEQTGASGRWLQPPQWIGWATRALTAPFRLVQRPFARTGLGTGLVVLAQTR